MKEEKNIEIDKKLKNKNFLDSWVNAFNGIIYAITTQSNVKKQLLIAVVTMLISLLFNLERAEFLCLIFTVVLIIVAEMFNTAIETVVDLYTDLYHPKAKIAKDVGAGAVVIAAINAVIVAYFLFFDKISDIGLNFIRNLVNNPVHLAFIGILLTSILIIALKAFYSSKTKNEKYFSSSGQAGLAFASITIIWLSTTNIVVLTLSFLLAILICVTRLETKKKKLSEVVIGAIAGVAVVALIYGLGKIILNCI